MKDFLHIIRDKPAYPVIFDAKRRVLSVPPIINGEHSKISLNTKNVFIEVTGIDKTKSVIVLDMMCTMFAEYCENKFEVEQVEVSSASGMLFSLDDSTQLFRVFTLVGSVYTPDWSVERTVSVEIDYLTKRIGLPVEKERVVEYLRKMQLPSVLSADEKSVVVTVPVIRSDILHACDVLEDVAIGYGFDKILDAAVTPNTVCRGEQQPVEKIRFVLTSRGLS